MANIFKVYKDDEVIIEGESPLTITGLEPNQDIAKGIYQAVRVDGEDESERVDVPAFKTLPVKVTKVTLSPKTSTATAGTEGTRQLSAEVAPTDATNKKVSYDIKPATEGLSVSAAGLISWSEAVSVGDYTTTVTTADGSKKDTHVLTLSEPDPVE